jgi:membrane fusion protein, multidrug efflux system
MVFKRSLSRAALTVALAAIAIVSGCRGGADEQAKFANPVVPVLVAQVEQKTVAYQIHAIGTVEAYSTVSVKARIDGRLDQVHFKQGDEVKQGQLLFTIDPKPLEAALRQAEAQLERDRAQMIRANADERRYSYLLKQKVGSQEQYDQAHANAAAARATVAADQAMLATAKLNLSYTSIHSPLDGRTGDLKLHVGNLVKANDASGIMVVINQVRPIYVDFSLPEKDLAEVRRAMSDHQLKVTAAAPSQAQEPAQGTLSFVDNTVDASTGMIALKGQFPNPYERLWPGEFVDVWLTLGEHPDALVVPAQAIQTGQIGTYVYVVDGHMTADTRRVVVGDSFKGDVIIERGLSKGEKVVTDGQLRLMPGAKVRIKGALGSSPAAAS